ncbi:Imm7 family immunity protein [Gimesia fumaroli]|uniref:Uncharacterized protein n=1 Tax=Gimesia fumaroli TaxID=2527976 RepID=A0A518IBG4_9PLAN|nr:Imm7 family immunity protein [Gimesia fumaroli]QDV50445.1 hypothetical protein Enr17x_24850 [Gimesia fumaroli]
MLEVYGWVVVRTSRDIFVNATFEELDAIDDIVDLRDAQLWSDLRDRLPTQESSSLRWQFYEHLNNKRGILQFCESTNHRSADTWALMDWIVKHATGSYGLIYVHDDEDIPSNKSYSRGQHDFSNVFRVWRILNGELLELEDPFLSPIVPTINPSEYS